MANLKTSVRLGFGFGLVLFFMTIISLLGISRLQAVAEATSNMTQVPLTKERLISDLYSSISTSVMRDTAIAKSTDPTLSTYFENITSSAEKNEADLKKKIEALLVTDEEKNLFKQVLETGNSFLTVGKEISQLSTDGKLFQAKNSFEQGYLPLSVTYLAQLQKMVQIQRDNINSIASQIDSIFKTSRILVLALSAIALACGILSSYLLTRSLLTQLGGEPHYAAAVAERIAGGDLTGEICLNVGDTSSLMFAIKRMRDSLTNIVSQVRASTDAIAIASTENAAGNMDLSSRTELQAASLEQTASSMHELTATVKQNAENARQANQLSVSASDVASRGGKVVGQVVTTMESIRDSSKKIVDIISVIDGIAFQTNILALNAAVEAARAGEQGRGFAVVAQEVRALAQRAANAAKEIKALIAETVEKVDAGGAQVNVAGSTMSELVVKVKHVADIMTEIMHASGEQSDGIEQVNNAIAHMDNATQQNAALVEEAAAAAESLQDQANTLASLVSVFKLASNDNAHSGTATTLSSARGSDQLSIKKAPSTKNIQQHAARMLT